MKILQINNNYFKSGGSETVFLNTIKLLQDHNHQLFVLSLRNSQNQHLTQSEYFIDRDHFLHNSVYSIHAINIVNNLLKHEKPDIVHIHNLVGGISLSLLALFYKRRIPVVSTIHNFRYLCPAYIFINGNGEICEKCATGNYYYSTINKCSPQSLVRSFLISIESYFRDTFLPYQKYIDKFLFVSKFTANKFIQYHPEIKSKSIQLYNFIYNFSSNDYKKYNGNYFLFVGRLDREKGIVTLLNAFKDLNGIKLLIVGDGPLKKYVLENKSTNVEYLGYKEEEELGELISKASFIIIPSECYENNPMVILEAYSKGTPVIGSNLGGIPEILINNETGYLFFPGNYIELHNIILKATNLSQSKYFELSKNAFDFAKKHFESENHYSNLMEIYSDIIKTYRK